MSKPDSISKIPQYTAIFDLDGTLANTSSDLIAALNHALSQFGIEQVDMSQINELVGQGAKAMIDRAVELRAANVTLDEKERMLEALLEHYQNNMPGQTECFEGVLELISQMRQAGWKTAICTNKAQKLADKLITSMGLSDYFDAICGGDKFAFKKPDGAHIIQTAKEAGGDHNYSVMFGDSMADINGAKDAAMASIGVTFGYTPTPMEQLQPSMSIESFKAINIKIVQALIDSHIAQN